jgi:hypothetical protein
MRKAFFFLALTLAFPLALYSQNVTADTIYLRASPLPLVPGGLTYAQYGTPGATATRYYWVSAIYPQGESRFAGPLRPLAGPAALNAANFFRLSWMYSPGALSYNVVRTASTVYPTTAATLLGNTVLNWLVDNGGALGAYLLPAFNPPLYSMFGSGTTGYVLANSGRPLIGNALPASLLFDNWAGAGTNGIFGTAFQCHATAGAMPGFCAALFAGAQRTGGTRGVWAINSMLEIADDAANAWVHEIDVNKRAPGTNSIGGLAEGGLVVTSGGAIRPSNGIFITAAGGSAAFARTIWIGSFADAGIYINGSAAGDANHLIIEPLANNANPNFRILRSGGGADNAFFRNNGSGGFAQNKLSWDTDGNPEIGEVGVAGARHVDFHSSANVNDYDTRIESQGGAAAAGQGFLWLYGSLYPVNGIYGDASGFKHWSVSTGAIAASTSAAVTLTWPTAFGDALYTPQCSVVEATASTVTLRLHHIESFAAATVVARVVNDDAGNPHTGTLYCTAVHQ